MVLVMIFLSAVIACRVHDTRSRQRRINALSAFSHHLPAHFSLPFPMTLNAGRAVPFSIAGSKIFAPWNMEDGCYRVKSRPRSGAGQPSCRAGVVASRAA